MKARDIYIQILHEVTGHSAEEIKEMQGSFEACFGKINLDKEYSPKDAEKLLNQLRAEKDGIRAWLERGGIEFAKDKGGTC